MNSNPVAPLQESILIIDDSPDNLRALSIILTKRGYKVRCATSGAMALASVKNLPPDLILLDIRMPVLDGYEVCQQLKADSQTREIPIIFLSAANDLDGKIKAFEVGGVDYIAKPFQMKEVLARITNQLTIQRLQNQLVEQNQRLQKEVDEHRQTEAALYNAKVAAEAANYAKSEFLSRMSHELRTPLNAILGFTELMRNDLSLSKDYQEYLASIHQSGENLLKSLNHVLAVTSTGIHELSVEERDVDLYQLLETIALLCQPKAFAKGLQLTVACAPTVPQSFYVDEGKLRQVLINLLENAIQFTQQGIVSLRVKVDSGQANSSEGEQVDKTQMPSLVLVFEIEDTGMGIADHEMSHLFQVFSQAEAGRKAGRGVGLGLFISRQFVRLMGGDITITSTPGQGTLVRFYILAQPLSTDTVTVQPPVRELNRTIETASLGLSKTPLPYSEEELLHAMQTVMSTEWLMRLHQAAVKGFDHQISQLIQEIPIAQTSLIKTLTNWNENFQFDYIVALTQQLLARLS
ncbi:MAG: response regulator [Leptolyngbya sp. BL-A-14]